MDGSDTAMAQFADVSFDAYDTSNTLRATASPETLRGVANMCAGLDAEFSRFREGGDLWRVNRSEGNPVPCSNGLRNLIARSIDFWRLTGGAFNPCMGPVCRLWRLKDPNFAPPEEGDVAAALELCDPARVTMDGEAGTVSVPTGFELDLGGIAKGHAADLAAEALLAAGITKGFANFGGTVRALGPKPDGSPWRLGLQTPFSDRGDCWCNVLVQSGACATSGVYERFAEWEGRRFHHIMDPRTGMPAQGSVLTATVLAPDATTADALSTALLIMGPQEGLPLALELGIGAMFLMGGGKVLCTPGFPIEVDSGHIA